MANFIKYSMLSFLVFLVTAHTQTKKQKTKTPTKKPYLNSPQEPPQKTWKATETIPQSPQSFKKDFSHTVYG